MNEKELEQLQMELCLKALEIISLDESADGFHLAAELDGMKITIDVQAELVEE